MNTAYNKMRFLLALAYEHTTLKEVFHENFSPRETGNRLQR